MRQRQQMHMPIDVVAISFIYLICLVGPKVVQFHPSQHSLPVARGMKALEPTRFREIGGMHCHASLFTKSFKQRSHMGTDLAVSCHHQVQMMNTLERLSNTVAFQCHFFKAKTLLFELCLAIVSPFCYIHFHRKNINIFYLI